MKFTLSWLKDHLDTDASVEEIAATLNRIGIEVEGVTDAGAALAPFRIARVVSAERHPQADKLQASDGASGNVYGYYSALAAKTALVGAYTATVDGEAKRGAAYFYTREE